MLPVGGGAALQGIGRSRGGPSTKVHLIVDALGLPLTFEVTEWQRGDLPFAPALVTRVGSRALLGDKAYDSDAFRAHLAAMNCAAVIPSKADRAQRIPYDRELYKARSEVECSFNLLKQVRRFASRYEKTLHNYTTVIAIDCAMPWLRR
jgi:transposase